MKNLRRLGDESTAHYTLPELAETVGIGYRTAHHWMQRGLLTPSVQQADGSGHPAVFTHHDCLRAALLARLRSLGLSIDGLEAVIDNPRPLIDALEEWCRTSSKGFVP